MLVENAKIHIIDAIVISTTTDIFLLVYLRDTHAHTIGASTVLFETLVQAPIAQYTYRLSQFFFRYRGENSGRFASRHSGKSPSEARPRLKSDGRSCQSQQTSRLNSHLRRHGHVGNSAQRLRESPRAAA